MIKQKRVRGIILDEDELMVIHRIKPDRDYYVFPGGGVEERETLIEALERELMEEINIKVKFLKELYTIENKNEIQHFMLCKYIEGHFGISDGPEYTSEDYKNSGQYIPDKIKINDLANYNVVPEEIKNQLLVDLKKDKQLNLIDKKDFFM